MSNVFNHSITFVFNVPFAKKDEAKSYGAKWMPEIKMWGRKISYSNFEGLEEDVLQEGTGYDRYPDALFNLKFQYFICTWDFEDSEMDTIKNNYLKSQKKYLDNKKMIAARTEEEQFAIDDAKYNAHTEKMNAWRIKQQKTKPKVEPVKQVVIEKAHKYEFDSDSDEEEKPKEYDYPNADRSKGEYDCFPNYSEKGYGY